MHGLELLQVQHAAPGREIPGLTAWLGHRRSWMLVAQVAVTAGLVAYGMVDETCVLWDSRSHLVGQSTQLARLRFPDELG